MAPSRNDSPRPAAPRARAALLLAALSLAPVAPGHAQCIGAIYDRDLTGKPLGRTPTAAFAWDPDGPGPQLERVAIFERMAVAISEGADWRVLDGTDPNYTWPATPGAFTSWDPDGAGPAPTRLVFADIYGPRWYDGDVVHKLSSGASEFENVTALVAHDLDGDGPEPPTLLVTTRRRIERLVSATQRKWERFGPSSSAAIRMATYDEDGDGPLAPALFISGDFGGFAPMRWIQVYRNGAWSPAGAGLNGPVSALQVWDPDGPGPQQGVLVASGTFTASGTTPLARLAAWNGSSWSQVGGINPGPDITALSTAFVPQTGRRGLLVGGAFTTIGGISAAHIALLDAGVWSAIGDGLDAAPTSITGANPHGPLSDDFHVYTDRGVWNGSEWQRDPGGAWPVNGHTPGTYTTSWDADGPGPDPARLVLAQHELWPSSRSNLFTWHPLEQWKRIPEVALPNSTIHAITPFDFDDGGPLTPGLLFAGELNTTDHMGVPLKSVGYWDGSLLRSIGGPLTGGPSSDGAAVRAIGAWDPDGPGPLTRRLVVSGDFTTNQFGDTVHNIAQFDGGEWRPMGAGLDGIATFMTQWDPDGAGPLGPMLLVSGPITTRDGQNLQQIVMFDGTSWRPFPGPIPESTPGSPRGDPKIYTMWDPDGPGPSPAQPIAVAHDMEITFDGYLSWGHDQTTRVLRWDGAAWVVIREESKRWGWYSPWPSFYGLGYVRLQTWDIDGPGPLSPKLLGIDEDTPSNLAFLSPDEPLNVRVRGEYGFDEFSVGESAALTWTTLLDVDATGPIPNLLIASGSFWGHTEYGPNQSNYKPGTAVARFMAGPPQFVRQPYPLEPNPDTRTIGIEILSIGPNVYSYQWSKNGVPLESGPTPWGSIIHSVNTSTLIISNTTPNDAGEYRCTLINSCGQTVSQPYTLDITFPPPCLADYNEDWLVDILDFLDLFEDFAACDGQPAPCGTLGNPDLNGDTLIDILDFLEFLDAFGQGC